MVLTTDKGWSESYEGGVGRTLTRTYTATLTAQELNYGPSALRAMAESLGLPIPFLSIVDGLVCKSCPASRVESKQVLVIYTAQFDNKFTSAQQQQKQDSPDPLNWKPIVKVRGDKLEVPIDTDRDGKHIANSAGVQLLDRLTIPDIDLGFDITCTLGTIPSWFLGYRRTQSSGNTTVWVIPPRGAYSGLGYSAPTQTLRYTPDPNSVETDQWNGINFVRLTFRLDVVRPQKLRLLGDTSPVSYQSWNHSLAYVDAGFTYKDTSSSPAKLKKITIGDNLEEPRQEMLLDGNGGFDKTKQDPQDVRHIRPLVYTDQSYTSLPGCSS